MKVLARRNTHVKYESPGSRRFGTWWIRHFKLKYTVISSWHQHPKYNSKE
jgi:hypothetical protein